MNTTSNVKIEYQDLGSESRFSETPDLEKSFKYLFPNKVLEDPNLTVEKSTPKEKQSSVLSFRDIQKFKPVRQTKIEQKKLPSFNTVARWECEVIEIENEDKFIAKLFNPESTDNQESSYEDYMEFSFSEINKEDKKFVKVGALFYFNIGHEKRPNGQNRNSSILTFRRMPVWKNFEKEIDEQVGIFKDLVQKHSK